LQRGRVRLLELLAGGAAEVDVGLDVEQALARLGRLGVGALLDSGRRHVLHAALAVGFEQDAVADHVLGAGLLLRRRLERYDGPYDSADDREDRDGCDGRDEPLEQLLALQLLLAGDAGCLAGRLTAFAIGVPARYVNG